MKKIIVMIITAIVVLSVGLAVLYALNTDRKEATLDVTTQNDITVVEESVQQTEAATSFSQEIPTETEVSYGPENKTIPETFTEPATVPETKEQDFVAELRIASSVSQMIVVSARGSSAAISMHEKSAGGLWEEILRTDGWVGENGVGQASEYDTKTPAGIYSLSFAFGIQKKPETEFSYTEVDDSDYWVDDVKSAFYNKFVSVDEVAEDWESAEHIIGSGRAYNYVIPIDYNLECVPGNGSAMFLHVSTGAPTGGCVSVPEGDMLFILQRIHPGCIILIDRQENILNY